MRKPPPRAARGRPARRRRRGRVPAVPSYHAHARGSTSSPFVVAQGASDHSRGPGDRLPNSPEAARLHQVAFLHVDGGRPTRSPRSLPLRRCAVRERDLCGMREFIHRVAWRAAATPAHDRSASTQRWTSHEVARRPTRTGHSRAPCSSATVKTMFFEPCAARTQSEVCRVLQTRSGTLCFDPARAR